MHAAKGFQPRGSKSSRQVKILALLVLVLAIIFFSPTIRLGLRELLPQKPVRVGTIVIPLPNNWIVSQSETKVSVWKPCATMLCGSTPRASFTVELSNLRVNSDDVWENATKKIFQRDYSKDATSKTINARSGPLRCVELDNAPVQGGTAVTSCISSSLGVVSAFAGEISLRPVFYQVVSSAYRTGY